jgi:hypothetical protein
MALRAENLDSEGSFHEAAQTQSGQGVRRGSLLELLTLFEHFIPQSLDSHLQAQTRNEIGCIEGLQDHVTNLVVEEAERARRVRGCRKKKERARSTASARISHLKEFLGAHPGCLKITKHDVDAVGPQDFFRFEPTSGPKDTREEPAAIHSFFDLRPLALGVFDQENACHETGASAGKLRRFYRKLSAPAKSVFSWRL